MAKERRVPLRICVGCREKKPKRELLRLVRTPEGTICLDPGGKMSGRGAYICRREACLARALKGNRLEKNLGHPLSGELVAAIRGLLESESDFTS